MPLTPDVPLKITPNKTFDEVPHPSVVVVPGGTAPTMRALSNERLLEYLRSAAKSADTVASVCTGSLLAQAGLLDDANATTHRTCSPQLERLGAHYLPERWVEEGKVIASAGVSAGMDMALQLVARLTDEQVSEQIQLLVEYDPQPPFGGIDGTWTGARWTPWSASGSTKGWWSGRTWSPSCRGSGRGGRSTAGSAADHGAAA